MDYTGKRILITGGAGSFGRQLAATLLEKHDPRAVIIYSRDEAKHYDMQMAPRFRGNQRLRFFLGDVRDYPRLARAFDNVDVVVHAAALKQVPAAEYNPFEAIKTNILGAQNIIEAAIDREVSRVVALSTDKAANPVNLYGATKLCSDKLFIAGNAYVGEKSTAFSVIRYGNVVGSTGSVVPFFLSIRKERPLPVTDERMTRFWITLDQGVDFVLDCVSSLKGGEVFVPKIPSMRVADLARVISPDPGYEIVGIRPGEKLHEVMVPEDDARSTVELDDRYVILPEKAWKNVDVWRGERGGAPCPDGFSYASNTNDWWLSGEELGKMIAGLSSRHSNEWAKESGFA